jgi:maltooligosyltrehalose trehalohydrolase
VLDESATEFRVWAPNRTHVDVLVDHAEGRRTHPLVRTATGCFQGVVDDAGAGSRYAFRLDGVAERPDPCSRFQPAGVHGPSEVIDPNAYAWRDAAWRGVPKSALVIYELHIGTFTPAGTFRAAEARLGELRELGVTAVEVMPVAQAPGRWNWGYDGVNLFAPSCNYGTPDDFRRFIDAAHAAGLAVILDVVYNHLGPEGNYLAEFGPYFTAQHHTPWGEALNVDGPESEHVRRYLVENALRWLDEYHLDGLRLDAVHMMFDDSDPHILHEISAAVGEFARTVDRRIHLIAETNCYDHRLLHPPTPDRQPYDAIWCDDIMHSIYAQAVPEVMHVHRSYRPETDLAESLRHGYVFAGPPERRVTRAERTELQPHCAADVHSFVVSLQNHDVIGNDPHGRRFHQVASPDAQMSAAALVLLYPAIPLLFMGEEDAADLPFRFFTDFTDEKLRDAVAKGRAREYPMHADAGAVSPVAAAAFTDSQMGPSQPGEMREWYRSLLNIRRRWRAGGSTERRPTARQGAARRPSVFA